MAANQNEAGDDVRRSNWLSVCAFISLSDVNDRNSPIVSQPVNNHSE